jgi:GTP-binding protein Era
LLEKIKNYLKTGFMLFPEDYYTSQDVYFRVSEIIREKVFCNTTEELPHSVYISVEEVEEKA